MRTIDREAVLSRWVEGAPAGEIAIAVGCSVGSVYRIAEDAFYSEGDPRGAPRSAEQRTIYEARRAMEKVAEKYSRDRGISSIASGMGLSPDTVRAAVYLATQSGLKTGLILGG